MAAPSDTLQEVARRGRPYAFGPIKLRFYKEALEVLKGIPVEDIAARTAFYARNDRRVIHRWGLIDVYEDPASDPAEATPYDVPLPPLSDGTLSKEEVTVLEAVVDRIKEKSRDWFRNCLASNNDEANFKTATDNLLAYLRGQNNPRPRKQAPYQAYKDKEWNNGIKEDFESYWATVKGLDAKKKRLSTMTTYLNTRLEGQTKVYQDDLKAAITLKHNAAMAEWRGSSDRPPVRTKEECELALTDITLSLAPLVRSLEEFYDVPITIGVCGPDKANDNIVTYQFFHSGVRSGVHATTWDDIPGFHTHVKPSAAEFAVAYWGGTVLDRSSDGGPSPGASTHTSLSSTPQSVSNGATAPKNSPPLSLAPGLMDSVTTPVHAAPILLETGDKTLHVNLDVRRPNMLPALGSLAPVINPHAASSPIIFDKVLSPGLPLPITSPAAVTEELDATPPIPPTSPRPTVSSSLASAPSPPIPEDRLDGSASMPAPTAPLVAGHMAPPGITLAPVSPVIPTAALMSAPVQCTTASVSLSRLPLPPLPDPSWTNPYAKAYNALLLGVPLGPTLNRLVRKVIAFDIACAFKASRVKVHALRPPEIAEWIDQKKPATGPTIHADISSRFRAWYLSIQPPERVKEGRLFRDAQYAWEFTDLNKSGPNGVVLIALVLVWWGMASNVSNLPNSNPERRQWLELTHDFTWVLKTMKMALKGGEDSGEESGDEVVDPPKAAGKRKRHNEVTSERRESKRIRRTTKS